MKCRETNKLFTAYLDNELSEDERALMQGHLDTCAECRQEIDMLSAAQTKLKQTLKMVTDTTAPSPRAWAKLRHQILDEKEAAVARVLPPRETWWEWMGKVSLIPWRLTWKTATWSALAMTLIIVASIAIPALTGHDEKALASEIALNNPDVKAALNGNTPAQIGTTANIDSSGATRVVMTLPPDKVVVADVDMTKREVTRVEIQSAEEITQQQVIDIAQADQRVKNILKMGYNIYYSGAAEFNVSLYSEEDLTEALREIEITNPQDFYGFMAAIMLKLNPGDIDEYLVFVNESIGKVVGVVKNPFSNGTPITITTTNTWELYK